MRKMFVVIDKDGDFVSGTETFNGEVTGTVMCGDLDDAKAVCDWWRDNDGESYFVAECEVKVGKVVYTPPVDEEEEVEE